MCYLRRYLCRNKENGVVFTPYHSKGIKVHVDADLAGNWDATEVHKPDTVRSQHGYVISYTGCPLVWKSQLQTENALSTTKAEYTGLAYSLRPAIPIMRLLTEMKAQGIPVANQTPIINCTVFEDNAGAIQMACSDKLCPRTKHMATKLHHFQQYVNNGAISIHHC